MLSLDDMTICHETRLSYIPKIQRLGDFIKCICLEPTDFLTAWSWWFSVSLVSFFFWTSDFSIPYSFGYKTGFTLSRLTSNS